MPGHFNAEFGCFEHRYWLYRNRNAQFWEQIHTSLSRQSLPGQLSSAVVSSAAGQLLLYRHHRQPTVQTTRINRGYGQQFLQHIKSPRFYGLVLKKVVKRQFVSVMSQMGNGVTSSVYKCIRLRPITDYGAQKKNNANKAEAMSRAHLCPMYCDRF